MAEYINREAVLDSLRELSAGLKDILKGLKYIEETQICNAEISTVYECAMRVTEQPIADVVEVKHGEWIKSIHKETPIIKDGRLFEKEHEVFCCSVCDVKIVGLRNMSFCPFCGAKMDGERKCDNG